MARLFYGDFCLLVADLALDLNVIVTFLLSDHLLFAGVLLTTFSTSMAAAVASGELRRFPGEVRETLRTGIRSSGYQAVLDRERGGEAPVSLLVSS